MTLMLSPKSFPLLAMAANNVFGDAMAWSQVQTSSGGFATFYPTDTGDATGAPLFKQIVRIIPTAISEVASARDIVLCAAQSVSADNTTVTVRVVVGANILGLGLDSLIDAPDGVSVGCTVVGI